MEDTLVDRQFDDAALFAVTFKAGNDYFVPEQGRTERVIAMSLEDAMADVKRRWINRELNRSDRELKEQQGEFADNPLLRGAGHVVVNSVEFICVRRLGELSDWPGDNLRSCLAEIEENDQFHRLKIAFAFKLLIRIKIGGRWQKLSSSPEIWIGESLEPILSYVKTTHTELKSSAGDTMPIEAAEVLHAARIGRVPFISEEAVAHLDQFADG